MHTVVAQSTFSSENDQNASGLERVPHCCGALHMQEEVICVQEQAIDSVRTLLREGRQGNIALRYVKMLKKCTPSWREAHFDDTTLKKHMSDRQNLN